MLLPALGLAWACASQSDRSPAVHTAASTAVPEVAGLVVHLPPPQDVAAILRVHRDGQGMDPTLASTTVSAGDSRITVPPGDSAQVRFGLGADALERLQIGGRDVLIEVPEGAVLDLRDDPCAGWALGAPWLDPNKAQDDVATCVSEDSPCPAGMAPAPGPALALDPLCPQDPYGQRCVLPARVRFDGESGGTLHFSDAQGTLIDQPVSPGDVVDLPPMGCGLPTLTTTAGPVGLAPGPGERWQITIDAQGAVDGAPL